MPKHHHKIFEMYDCRDEAIRALTPKFQAVNDTGGQDMWDLERLTVSRSANVTHVEFQHPQDFGEEAVSDLRSDFAMLADKLDINSKVLVDFTGVRAFCSHCIDVLVRFNKVLRHRGSRIALCCLEDETRLAFFSPLATRQ